jgi:hypothetical protein
MPEETIGGPNPQKTDGLEIHAVDGEVVAYETQADRVHYLNPTAGLILEFCDGTTSTAQIAALVREAYALPEAPLDEVIRCVADLRNTGIVV